MSDISDLHPNIPRTEYRAFEELLRLINVSEPGKKTSFDQIAYSIAKFLFAPEMKQRSMIRSEGVWYFPFGDKRFAIDKDQLRDISRNAEGVFRSLIGDYLYSYARDHAEYESKEGFFVDNMRFHVEIEGPGELEPTMYLKISLFHPYKPKQRAVLVSQALT